MTNPYLRLLQTSEGDTAPAGARNPYSEMLDNMSRVEDQQRALTLNNALTVNPDEEAELRKLHERGKQAVVPSAAPDTAIGRLQAAFPVPPSPALIPDKEQFKLDLSMRELMNNIADTPVLKRKYTQEDFARIAHDDSLYLSSVERTLRGAGNETGDAARSFFASVPATLGGALSGLGEFYNAAVVFNYENIIKNIPVIGRGVEQAVAAEQEFWARHPETAKRIAPFAGPGEYLKTTGGGYTELAAIVRPDKVDLEDQIAEGVGQVLVTIATAWATGGTTVPTVGFMAMGANQQAEALREVGIDPSQRLGELSAGAAVTGGSELLRLSSMMRALPPALRDRVAKSVIGRISGQAFEEGVQEALEGAAHNLITMTYDEDASLLEGVPEQGLVGASVGGIVQGLAELLVPGKQRILAREAANTKREELSAESQLTMLERAIEDAGQTKLAGRDRAALEEFVNEAAEGTAMTEVFIAPDSFAQVAQSLGMEIRDLAQQLGVEDQIQDSALASTPIVVPVGKFISTVADTDLAQPLMEVAKLNPFLPSRAEIKAAQEAGDEQFIARAEALAAAVEQDETVRAEAQVISERIAGELTTAGRFTGDANRVYATAATQMYVQLAERLGITPQQAFDQYPLSVAGQRIGGQPEGQVLASGQADTLTGVQVSGMDAAIANGVGTISVIEDGKPVPFKNFALSVDGNIAEVGMVERAQGARRGIGYDAYAALGDALAARGITLQSSELLQAPGKKLWERLVASGKARWNTQTKRFEFIAKAPVAPKSSLPTLFHGGRAGLTLADIQIVREPGATKQGKRNRVYGGFYGTSKLEEAQGYAEATEGSTVYRIELAPDAKVETKEGDVTRLSAQTIQEYRDRGVDVVVGKDPRGRTEYVIVNKDAITGLVDTRQEQSGTVTQDAGPLAADLPGSPPEQTFPPYEEMIAAQAEKTAYQRTPEFQRIEGEINTAYDDIANTERTIATELRDMGYTWDGEEGDFMNVIDSLRREGRLGNYLASQVEDLRNASGRLFDAEDQMKAHLQEVASATAPQAEQPAKSGGGIRAAAMRADLPGSPQWEAAVAKGLDMSTEARMARAEEQGFTIEAFRGVRVAPGAGKLTDAQMVGGGWFAATPETANTYAADVPLSRNKGLTMKARLKFDNPLVIDAGGAMFDRVPGAAIQGLEGIDPKRAYTTQEIARLAEQQGFDGVEFQNIKADRESSRAGTQPGTIWYAANPANIRSVNAAFDPDQVASADLLAQDGETLGQEARKADTSVAGGLTEKSFIGTRELEGVTIFPMFADLTDAGSTFAALDGLPIAPTPYLGGPNFPWLSAYRDAGIVWAFNAPGVITKVRNKVKALQKQARAEGRSDRVIITMLAMKDDAHTSNEMVISALLRTLDAVVEAGRFPQEQLAEAKKLIVSKAGKKDEGYSELATFPGFDNAEALHDWSRGATFAGRKALAKEMRSAKFQQLPGMFPVERIVREAIDPDYRATQQGDALLAFEIDPDAEDLIIDFDDPRSGNIPRHPAYRYGMRGELVGSFSTHIPMEVLYGDLLPKIVNRAKEGANPKFLMERLKTADAQVVTEDIIRTAEVIEGLHDYRIAQAHTAGIAGQWRSSDVAANKGGVNPVEFERALLENEAAATLTPYTRTDVTKGKKDGSLRVFQLGEARVQDGGLNVWMAVKTGYDYRNEYPGEVTDALVEQGILTDNEVALVGVASNELGVKGMATFQVLKGIEEGVTVLDAFKVTSPSKPDGLLPTIYATLGFEEVGQIPFDPKYYDAQQLADLKAIWTRQGWNEADGYPAVAIMKWRGDDAVRPEATRRFILESQAGLGIRGDANSGQHEATRTSIFGSPGQGDQGDGLPGQGDGRADPRRFADRARGVSDTVRSYVENILAADARAIKALKLPQELIDRIRAEYGPALAAQPDETFGQGEGLVSAAVRIGGKTYTGRNHDEAAQAARADGQVVDDINETAGFVDSRGKFLRRDDPEAVYAAIAAGQLDPARQRVIEIALRRGDTVTLTSDMLTFAEPGYQARGRRGEYSPRLKEIRLNASADFSTFLHELGHHFLEVYDSTALNLRDKEAAGETLTEGEQGVIDDTRRLLTELARQTNIEVEGDVLDWWRGRAFKERVPMHEQFARLTEAYFMEGKAPTPALQTMFQTFRRWMLQVYSSLTELNVELNDEVRGILDRMVAAETDIKTAEQNRGLNAMFATKPEFMTDDEWRGYQQLALAATQAAEEELTARSLRDMKWLSRAKAREIRKLQKQAAEQRAIVEAAVTAEVMSQPINRARTFLKRGLNPDGTEVQGPHKLSIEMLKSAYPEGSGVEWTALGYGRYGMLGKDGLDADMVAELFGFDSGDALIRALLEAEPAEATIEGETDRRMLEEFGDLVNEEAINRAADEALHNAMRGRVLAAEYAALAKASGQRKMLAAAAQQIAKQVIGKQNAAKLKPQKYVAAERSAARKAEQALRRNDLVGAATAKRDQLLNFELAREAQRVLKQRNRTLDLFRRVTAAKRDTVSKTRNYDLVQVARAILAAHGMGQVRNAPIEYMDLLKQYDPRLYTSLETTLLVAAAQNKTLADLSVDEFLGLGDLVKQLWDLSREEKQIEIDGRKVELEQITTELTERLATLGDTERGQIAEAATDAQKNLRSFVGLLASIRRVESWARGLDGGETGPFTKYIWRPISEAADRYRADRNRLITKFRELFVAIEPTMGGKKIAAPELGYTFKNKAELLHAILHTGNTSNKRKLLLGRQWGSERPDGTLDESRWQQFISRMAQDGTLTKADFDFAQGVWDLLEETKPLAQATHRKVFGRYFAEITAEPVDTPFGTYKGGYVPAIYDQFFVADAAVRAQQEQVEANDSTMFPSPASGFTKGRVEYNEVLELNLQLLPMHIDRVLKFAHLASPVRDVLRILRDKEFARGLEQVDPTAQSDMLLPWLQRASRQIVEEPSKGQAGRMADQFFRTLRNRSGMGLMFANLVNVAQQFTGFPLVLLRVKPQYVGAALARYTANPARMTKAARGASLMMVERGDNQMSAMYNEIERIIDQKNLYGRTVDWLGRHTYFMQQAVQNVMDVVVWTGAYDQALARGATEAEAAKEGDAVVRETQGSVFSEDVARIETGPTWARTFTHMYSYFSMWGNLLGTEVQTTMREAGLRKGAGRLMFVYMMGFLAPAITAQLVADALRGQLPEDEEDDGYLDNWLSWFFMTQAKTALAFVPIAGQAGNAAIGAFTDVPYDDRVGGSPAISAIETAVRTPASVYEAVLTDGDKSRAVKDTLNLMTLLTGIPFQSAARPIGYAVDVAEGDIEPTSDLDYLRGLATGTASEASR